MLKGRKHAASRPRNGGNGAISSTARKRPIECSPRQG